MKRILLLVCFSLIVITINAQSRFKYRIIQSYGISLERIITAPQHCDFTYYFGSEVYNRSFDLYSSFLGSAIQYELQFNMMQFSKESSMSLSLPLKFGKTSAFLRDVSYYFNEENKVEGIGYLKLPITIDYNYGIGSTYNTVAEWGLSIGVGMQILITPIFIDYYFVDQFSSIKHENRLYTKPGGIKSTHIKRLFYSPILKADYRFWQANKVPSSFSIYFSPGKKYTLTDNYNRIDFDKISTWYVGLAYSVFFKY